MASLFRRPNGSFEIHFVNAEGKRPAIRLGKMTKEIAEKIRIRVDRLNNAIIEGRPVDRDTAVWLANQDNTLHAKLADKGLCAPRVKREAKTLEGFIDEYISSRADVKDSSKTVWKRCKRLLLQCFKASTLMDEIGPGQAKDFRQFMLKQGKAENTVRKMCSVACQFFADALDREIVAANPFDRKDIPRTTKENRKRDSFLSVADAEKVLKACPDAEWRVIVALSRFGGLRCPSEHLKLRWQDVLWKQQRVIVTSPKTEHHEGKEMRIIPLFPELLPYLEQAFEQAEEGSEFVITRYRSGEQNLRTQLERIIKKAGLKPWPKLFHNLRATRQTELERDFPTHVVCAWLGNSRAVAMRHYLQVQDADFDAAVSAAPVLRFDEKAQQHVVESAAYDGTENQGVSSELPVPLGKTQETQQKRGWREIPANPRGWTLQDSNL